MQAPNHSKRPVEFGDYLLEPVQRRLLRRRTGEAVALTGKAFDTLLYLVDRRGQVLTKEELLTALWPEVIVEENSLTQCISTLRQALGETRGENRYIATVPRRGYQFVATVIERDPAVPTRSRSRRLFWVGATVVLALLAGLGFVFLRPSAPINPLRSVLGGTKYSATYLLYSNGRYALARSDEASLTLAVQYFEQALARDQKFALAHAGIADAYMIMGVFGMRAPVEVLPRARDAALKALQIEPRLAIAHAVLGHIKQQYDRDWDGAEAEFRRAIELDPGLSDAQMYLGVLLAMRGDVDGGLQRLKDAEQLAPLLTLPKTRLGAVLYYTRHYDEAIAELKASVALDDRPAVAHRALGRAYLQTGQYDLAFAEFAKTKGISPGSYADVAMALALSGRRTEALAELNRLLALQKQHYVSSFDIAAIYASLGDNDHAFESLERALEERAPMFGFLPQNPAFDSLHGDPRFADLVARLGVRKRPSN
jgi:DNA-binding winged helix-turn-helix (wHTH) protein/Tfp pilus assembly protein PilF